MRFHARNVGAVRRTSSAICDVFITALDVHDRVQPCYMVHKPIVFAAAGLAVEKLLRRSQDSSLAKTSLIGCCYFTSLS